MAQVAGNLGSRSDQEVSSQLTQLEQSLTASQPRKKSFWATPLGLDPAYLLQSRLKFAVIEDGLPGHIRFQDHTVPRAKGIGGAHSTDAFDPAVTAMGARVNSRTPHPTLLGVEKRNYSIPSLDSLGVPTGGFKAKPSEKTVYDPTIISHADFLTWGREAANDALARRALTREWTGTASNGIVFRGYLNSRGAVRSFFPDI